MSKTITKTILDSIALGPVNFGRADDHQLVLDMSNNNGLFQSIASGFDSSNETIVLVSFDDPDLPFTKAECIAHTNKVLASVAADFGTTKDGKQKTKSVQISDEDGELLKVTVSPEQLVMPADWDPQYVCLTGNRRNFHGKACDISMGRASSVADVRVEPFKVARAIARRENVMKTVGVESVSKKGIWYISKESIGARECTSATDLERTLKVSRNMAQSVFGPAQKANKYKQFDAMCVKDEIPGKDGILFGMDKMPHTIGSAIRNANGMQGILDACEKYTITTSKSKCMKGKDIKEYAEGAYPLTQRLLMAVVTNNHEGVKNALAALDQLEIDAGTLEAEEARLAAEAAEDKANPLDTLS
jgi:hypothetical protein